MGKSRRGRPKAPAPPDAAAAPEPATDAALRRLEDELDDSLDAHSGRAAHWLDTMQAADGKLHSLFLVDGFQLSGSGLGRHWYVWAGAMLRAAADGTG
jgi:hypothetical protein